MRANGSGNAGQVEWEEAARREFQPGNAVWGGLGLSEEPVKILPYKIPPDLGSEESQEKAGGGKGAEWVFYPSRAPLGAATVEKMENPTWNGLESNADTVRAQRTTALPCN